MANTGRPRTCECGTCSKCKQREAARLRYQALSLDERRAIIAARDPAKVKAADRARYHRDPEKRKALQRRINERNPEPASKAKKSWQERNPEKARASWAVCNAVRDGKLIKPDRCEVDDGECRGKIEGHHEDYSKPLEVRWLCVLHHEIADRERREREAEQSSRLG